MSHWLRIGVKLLYNANELELRCIAKVVGDSAMADLELRGPPVMVWVWVIHVRVILSVDEDDEVVLHREELVVLRAEL